MDLGDWALTALAGIVIGVISGVITFFGTFNTSKKEIYTMLKDADQKIDDMKDSLQKDWDRRHDKVEQDIKNGVAATGLHAVQLGEIRINQININASLNEIKTLIRNGSH